MIETDDKLPDGITLKNVVISVTSVFKDDDKFHPQVFLEDALIAWKLVWLIRYW